MRRFGLIGRPLGHSASAAYFTEKFNREGINDCEYSLYELGAIGDLPGLLERLPELCGLNVTIPYKRDVMAFLDSVSPEAEAIGAVNCIRRTADGRLAGHNTDVIGLRAALNELLGAAQPVLAHQPQLLDVFRQDAVALVLLTLELLLLLVHAPHHPGGDEQQQGEHREAHQAGAAHLPHQQGYGARQL